MSVESVPSDTSGTPGSAPDATASSDAGESVPDGKSAELKKLARDANAYARALGHLVVSEAALARINIVRLLLLALAVPAIVFGILLGVDALLAAIALRIFSDWSIAVICVLAVNVALLAWTLLLLRRWWRSLSLPRSRAALARAFEALK